MMDNLIALGLWRSALVASVRRPGPDLTARQLALLLTVYLNSPPHTVRGLAEILNVSKPAVSRALDRLSVLGYIRRKRDDGDRRNVLIQRTTKGSVYLSEFSQLVVDAGVVHPNDLAAMVAAQMNAASPARLSPTSVNATPPIPSVVQPGAHA